MKAELEVHKLEDRIRIIGIQIEEIEESLSDNLNPDHDGQKSLREKDLLLAEG